jgi:diacylglycerol kinase
VRVAGAIILGVVGAVLAFAVSVDASGFSINTIGWIMMIGAAIWFVAEAVNSAMGNRTESVETVRHEDGTVEQRERQVETRTE